MNFSFSDQDLRSQRYENTSNKVLYSIAQQSI